MLQETFIMKNFLLPLLILLIFNLSVFAQEEEIPRKKNNYTFQKPPTKKIALDLYGGLAVPAGDVKVDLQNKFPLYNVGAGLSYNLTSVFSLRADYNYTRLQGQNSRAINNEFFENRIHKWSIGTEVHLFNLFRFSQISKRIQPFVGVGIGQIKSNVEAGLDGEVLPEHTYDGLDLATQVSAGFRVNITKWLDAFFRFDIHFTKTDSLDGFDWDLNVNKYYDNYFNTNLGLTFKIGKKGVDHYFWVRDEFNAKNLQSEYEQLKRELYSLSLEYDSVKQNLNQLAQEASSCCDEMRNSSEAIQREIDELNQKINSGMFSADSPDDVYRADVDGATPNSYHVIVGSFNNKNNALSEQKRLENEGHTVEILYENSLQLNRLSIASSMNFNNIKSYLENYRRTVNSKSWILQVK